jgi:hypothetical protein
VRTFSLLSTTLEQASETNDSFDDTFRYDLAGGFIARDYVLMRYGAVS